MEVSEGAARTSRGDVATSPSAAETVPFDALARRAGRQGPWSVVDAHEYARDRLRARACPEAEGPAPDERLRPALVQAVTQCLDLDAAVGDWFQTLRLSLEDLAAQPMRRDDPTLALIYGEQDVVSWRSEHAHAPPSPSLNRRLMLRDDILRCAYAARSGRLAQQRWAAMRENATAGEVRRVLDRVYAFRLGSLARWERFLHGSSFFLSTTLNRQVSSCAVGSFYRTLALAGPWVDPAIRLPHAGPIGSAPSLALHQLHAPLADLAPVPGPARTPRRVVTLRQTLRDVAQTSPGLGRIAAPPGPQDGPQEAKRSPAGGPSTPPVASGSSEEDGCAFEEPDEAWVDEEEEPWPPPRLATDSGPAARRPRRVPVRLRMERRGPPQSGAPSPRPDPPRPSATPAPSGPGASPPSARVDGGPAERPAPNVHLRARSLATLAEMLAPGYPAPVTVRAYLHLLEDFIATNVRGGYLRRVTHLSGHQPAPPGSEARAGVRLSLGVGESLSFTRFDGLRCVMGFHYPHDRDGHQHRKVPKEYKTQYLRVFSMFGIRAETVVVDAEKPGPRGPVGAPIEAHEGKPLDAFRRSKILRPEVAMSSTARPYPN